MNTDYLRYFSTLAELQHYGNAAKELNISQPGLSHAIHSLEKDYGLPLFEKTGRNVRLSPYGLKLKKYIDLLDELEKFTTHKEFMVCGLCENNCKMTLTVFNDGNK